MVGAWVAAGPLGMAREGRCFAAHDGRSAQTGAERRTASGAPAEAPAPGGSSQQPSQPQSGLRMAWHGVPRAEPWPRHYSLLVNAEGRHTAVNRSKPTGRARRGQEEWALRVVETEEPGKDGAAPSAGRKARRFATFVYTGLLNGARGTGGAWRADGRGTRSKSLLASTLERFLQRGAVYTHAPWCTLAG